MKFYNDVPLTDYVLVQIKDKIAEFKRLWKSSKLHNIVSSRQFINATKKRFRCASCTHCLVMKFPPSLDMGVSREWKDSLERFGVRVEDTRDPLKEANSRLEQPEMICGHPSCAKKLKFGGNSCTPPLKWSQVSLKCKHYDKDEAYEPPEDIKILVNEESLYG